MPQPQIDSAEELFRKFERTYHRRQLYGEWQIDWVFDLATTAWHLVDWTAHLRGIAPNTAQNQFKQQCPELAVCEQLCNGVKHRALDNPNLQPFDVTTNVQSTYAQIGVSRFDVMPGDENADVCLTAAVVVVDKDGKTWQALLLFLAVLRFWQRELGVPLAAG